MLSAQQLLNARNALVEAYEEVSLEVFMEDFSDEKSAIVALKKEIRDLLKNDK